MTEDTTEAPEADEPTDTVLLQEMLSVGATYRQLDYWVRQGYLHPREPEPGSGFQRRWTTRDRDMAALILRLSKVVAMEHAVVMAERCVDEDVHEYEVNGITIRWEWPTGGEET